jgi:beta-glucosidase
MEGEEGQREGVANNQHSFGDRNEIDLPGSQEELLKAVYATGVPIILVLLNGSAVTINWAEANIPGIIEAWYPGQSGGTAVAQVLFGDYNPAGRLPVTVYQSIEQLPAFDDYKMKGRTYRYFNGEPLYRFGFGLSYTQYKYRLLAIQKDESANKCTISVEITNSGERDGDEVVQVYLKAKKRPDYAPGWSLGGFKRVPIKAGKALEVSFDLTPDNLSLVDESGQLKYWDKGWQIAVGGISPGIEQSEQDNLIFAEIL